MWDPQEVSHTFLKERWGQRVSRQFKHAGPCRDEERILEFASSVNGPRQGFLREQRFMGSVWCEEFFQLSRWEQRCLLLPRWQSGRNCTYTFLGYFWVVRFCFFGLNITFFWVELMIFTTILNKEIICI